MKKRVFSLFLACAFSAMILTGCDSDQYKDYWVEDIAHYVFTCLTNDNSGMKKIDRAHKEAFESVFNDIEIFGARLCVPMKVSDLPDKFEISNSYREYIPLSENQLEKNQGAAPKTGSFNLYYDREVEAASVSIVWKPGQSIDEGIIYELKFNILLINTALLGGQLDVRSDIGEIKNFLGEGNEFIGKEAYTGVSTFTIYYTDGNRMIEFCYGKEDDDIFFFWSYIRTYNEL